MGITGPPSLMVHQILTQLRAHPGAMKILVISTLIIAFAANLYGLLVGVTIVIPHLFYLPIILTAFFYPRRGVLFVIALSAAYFLMVAVIRPGNMADIVSAAGRCIVYVLIAAVVSYLSERVNSREKDLVLAKEEWERTFHAVPDLIALIGMEHRILRVNLAMAKSLGIRPEEAVGKRCYEIVHRSGKPPANCPHAKLLADGKEHSEEIHEDILNGDFMVSTSPLHDGNGNLIGSVHVARDVTDRKKAEEALREKSEELDRFFSVNLDMLCIADTDGNFHRLNIAWERTLGYSREELMSMKFLDLVHPDDLPKTLEAVALLAAQKEVVNFTNRYRCSDGSYRWIEWRSYPYGNLIYAAARDITDRLQGENALIQANKKLNILSSITRHDILNKITALYAFLDISRETCTNKEQCVHIDKEIETVQALQRQIEFTRFYQDIGVKAPEWQDLGTVFSRAVSQIPLGKISAETETGTYQVYADPLFEKVFYNMLENSLRHGEHVTAIRLSAQENAESLRIVYEDNGAGVPYEIKGKLFQRGFGKHTGLGLFLTREILAITGITVTENGEPGKGARFEIIVPAGGFRLRKE